MGWSETWRPQRVHKGTWWSRFQNYVLDHYEYVLGNHNGRCNCHIKLWLLSSLSGFWWDMPVHIEKNDQIFSIPPLDASRDKKSTHTISMGCVVVILVSGARCWTSAFLRRQRLHRSMWVAVSFAIPGQKKRSRSKSNTLSLPIWPTSLWQPSRALSLRSLGMNSGYMVCCEFSDGTRCHHRSLDDPSPWGGHEYLGRRNRQRMHVPVKYWWILLNLRPI